MNNKEEQLKNMCMVISESDEEYPYKTCDEYYIAQHLYDAGFRQVNVDALCRECKTLVETLEQLKQKLSCDTYFMHYMQQKSSKEGLTRRQFVIESAIETIKSLLEEADDES